MPKVVTIAISEATRSVPMTTRSTRVRARKSGRTRENAQAAPARPTSAATTKAIQPQRADDRSEEHTSELQSLMRTSYAVFCLKKKNTHTSTDTEQTRQPLQQQHQ